jgi:hypothetical protein
MFRDTFGFGPGLSIGVLLFICLVTISAVFWFFYSAPPRTLILTSGPPGSIFQRNAERYQKILARNGVKLKILPSQGSLENLKRLADPAFHADIGFVQGGVAEGQNIDNLVSLGSVSYEPLLVFYRGTQSLELLSQLQGKRLAVGSTGSGTRSLALALLAANDVQPGGGTQFVDLDAENAAQALLEGGVDCVFLMGDVASPQLMRRLLRAPGIQIFDFMQADAYTRRITYLNKLILPQGSIDFGKNIPDQNTHLIGPTVELIARAGLHPALSDLLLETAREVHGKAGLLKRHGEFPAPLEHEFPVSAEAKRYYKSGKSFLYRYLPFWPANLLNRVLVVFVPMLVVLIPVLRFIPAMFRWHIRLRIYRWYRSLLTLEKEVTLPLSLMKREELLDRLDRIEEGVNKMKVPAFFADQFYFLREHIRFVHRWLMEDRHDH